MKTRTIPKIIKRMACALLILTIVSFNFSENMVYAKQTQIDNNEITKIGQTFLEKLYSDEENNKNEKYTFDSTILPIYDVNESLIGYALTIQNNENEKIGTMFLEYNNGNLTLSESSIEESISNNYKTITEQNKVKEMNDGNIISDDKLVKIDVMQYVGKQEVKDKSGKIIKKYYDLRNNKDVSNVIEEIKKNNKTTKTNETLQTTNNSLLALAPTITVYGKNRLRMDFYFFGDSNYGGNQSWYGSGTVEENSGCGPVSLANISAYYAKYRLLGNLYNEPAYTPGQYGYFVDHMRTLYNSCQQLPGNTGVDTTSYINGFNAFSSARGYSFSTYNTPYRMGNTSLDPLCNTIMNEINIDAPVGLFINLQKIGTTNDGLIISGNQSDAQYFKWHWVTITRYDFTSSTVPVITVSSWNLKYDLNLSVLAQNHDLDTVYFANSSFKPGDFTLTVGQHITAIDSYPGMWEFVNGQTLYWCNAGNTSTQSSSFPKDVVVNASEPAWKAPVLHYLASGEQFTAVGSISGWWQVQWGSDYGWVYAGSTSYVVQSSTFPKTLKSNLSNLPIFKNKGY